MQPSVAPQCTTKETHGLGLALEASPPPQPQIAEIFKNHLSTPGHGRGLPESDRKGEGDRGVNCA